MADFCKQCSIEIFGFDSRDMAEIVSKQEEVEGLAANVLCEGCGPTQVDSAGECLFHKTTSAECLKEAQNG